MSLFEHHELIGCESPFCCQPRERSMCSESTNSMVVDFGEELPENSFSSEDEDEEGWQDTADDEEDWDQGETLTILGRSSTETSSVDSEPGLGSPLRMLAAPRSLGMHESEMFAMFEGGHQTDVEARPPPQQEAADFRSPKHSKGEGQPLSKMVLSALFDSATDDAVVDMIVDVHKEQDIEEALQFGVLPPSLSGMQLMHGARGAIGPGSPFAMAGLGGSCHSLPDEESVASVTRRHTPKLKPLHKAWLDDDRQSEELLAASFEKEPEDVLEDLPRDGTDRHPPGVCEGIARSAEIARETSPDMSCTILRKHLRELEAEAHNMDRSFMDIRCRALRDFLIATVVGVLGLVLCVGHHIVAS